MGINLAQFEAHSEAAQGGLPHKPFADAPVYTPAMLGPMLAGAQARGMADAFDLVGQGAILVDRAGMALHANHAARKAFGASLALTHRHLVGHSASQTREIQALISSVLEGQGQTTALVLDDGKGSARLTLEVLAVPGTDSNQLLKAVVLVRRA